MYSFDYMLFAVLPVMVLSGLASLLTKTTFKRYSQVMARSRVTGAQAAKMLLDRAGIHDVGIEKVQGFLSDHYDPRNKKLRLSPAVYDNPSLSAIGVACHEAGHAIQHATAYGPLTMRSKMVPVTSVTSNLAMPLIIGGFFLGGMNQTGMGGTNLGQLVMLVGVAGFAMAFLFALVTLPVEWDASARAKKLMVSAGIVAESEAEHAGRVLNAAFLTYLAAAIGALMTLLYWLWKLGIIGGRRN